MLTFACFRLLIGECALLYLLCANRRYTVKQEHARYGVIAQTVDNGAMTDLPCFILSCRRCCDLSNREDVPQMGSGEHFANVSRYASSSGNLAYMLFSVFRQYPSSDTLISPIGSDEIVRRNDPSAKASIVT